VAERDATARALDPTVLPVFEKLSNAYDGEGVAEVEAQDLRRREFICAGCFMQLPVEVVNGLIVRSQNLTKCPNCDRILLMPDALKETLAVKSPTAGSVTHGRTSEH
jgi:predicted  nucleic acid-binding Zn-ribbon protein